MKHKKTILKALLLSIIIFIGSGFVPDPSEIFVTIPAQQIKKYEPLFIKIIIKQSFTNPYDPEDIMVDALINQPDGNILKLPCFYKDGISGNSEWEARFTPVQSGKYSLRIQSVNKDGTAISNTYNIEVKESNNKGFLRLNPKSKYTFQFDNGELFRGIGMNLGWEVEPKWGNEKRYTYEMFFDELEKNKANFIRTWMCPWNLPLEWTRMISYNTFIDEFENWDKVLYHTKGLALDTGKTEYSEDDLNRVIVKSGSKEKIIYNINDIRKFKLKLFFYKEITPKDIKCYSSKNNKFYEWIDAEFSQTWNTTGDWHRIFIAAIKELPAGTNYLMIEFNDSLTCKPNLGGISIEHGEPSNIVDAPGLGRYYQKTADKLDTVLSLAEEKGIFMMLTFDYHGIFKPKLDRWGSNDEWRRNPYNIENGGPCQNPEDFFTNTEAKKIYKKRLRYIVARWGYSTYMACWEFWNEIDNVMAWQGVSAASITSWHREMADYLKQIDPYKHLVSTSVVNREVPGLWNIENIDFTQHHNYGPTGNMKKSILKYVETYNKPDVVGEFSIGWKGPGKDYPVELYEGELHNGIWRGMFSPCPILPMTWWWEWHYDQKHYYHFKTAADFVLLMINDNNNNLVDIPVSCSDQGIEALGLKCGDNIFIWLFNLKKETLKDITLTINGTLNSEYLAKYYNTWKGIFTRDEQINPVNFQFNLKNIQLLSGYDMAVWIKPYVK